MRFSINALRHRMHTQSSHIRNYGAITYKYAAITYKYAAIAYKYAVITYKIYYSAIIYKFVAIAYLGGHSHTFATIEYNYNNVFAKDGAP